MKSILIILSVSFVFLACNQTVKKQIRTSFVEPKKEEKANPSKLSTEEKSTVPVPKEENDDGGWKWSECVRSEPEAIGHSKAFKKHSFRIDSTSTRLHIGYENITLENGDLLKITNAGCEYYVLEFQFTTSRFSKDTADLAFWSSAAIDLLKSVEKNVDAPFNMQDSYPLLKSYYENSGPDEHQLGFQQQFNDSEIANTISMDRIEKLGAKYRLTITYAVGPL